MKELILKITNVNWGMKGPGTWDKIKWKIHNDYTVDCKVSFVAKDSQVQYAEITKNTYEELTKNIKLAKDINIKVDACDGEAWEFILYNNGHEVWKKELGYIYGIEPLENISNILKTLNNNTHE